MRFWIVNVFVHPAADGSVAPQAGNPLAVVECAPGALTTAQMQAIAFEFGFSETTFVSPMSAEGAWPTRIFTPTDEMPFAGHPTLGTAHVIRAQLGGEGEVTLSLPVGRVPVRQDADGCSWLSAPPVRRDRLREPVELADAWGFDASIIDLAHPAADYDAGPKPTIVPLRSVELLERFVPPASGPGSLYVVARDGQGVRVRLFAPGHGVPEDPATGSAACCLGGYVLDTDYLGLGARAHFDVYQGAEMGRPSLLHVRAERGGGSDRVEVGGRVQAFASGELD